MRKIILAIIVVLNMLVVPVSAEENSFVESIKLENGAFVVMGTAAKRNENVSVNVLHRGKTAEDLQNIADNNSLNLTVKSTRFAVSDDNKNYSVSFSNVNNELAGCEFVVTSRESKYVGIVPEDIVKFITFDDEKIKVEGKVESKEVTVLLLDPGITIDSYSGGDVSFEKSLSPDENDEFFVDIPIEYQNEPHSLYVINEDLNTSYCYEIKRPVKLYIDKQGSDSNSGTAESPFATIDGAREYAKNNYKDVPVNVIINAGEYALTDTVTFTSADSRNVNTPLRFKGNGDVTFSGAKKLDISAFSTVTDESIKGRLYESVQDEVLCMNLSEQGVADTLINFIDKTDSSAITFSPNITRFYLNDSEQRIARYPNEGYNKIESVKNAGATSSSDTARATFTVTDTDISRWQNAKEMCIEGMIGVPFVGEWARVGNISGNTITLKHHTKYGVKKDYKWAAINLLEEIDVPGEWFIDKSSKMLYYYPPRALTSEDSFEIAGFNKDVFVIDSASHLQFEGLGFEKLNDSMHSVYHNRYSNNIFEIAKNTGNLKIKGCDASDIGGSLVVIVDSNHKDITVEGCKIERAARGLGNFSGGSIKTLSDANIVVKNCEVSEWGNLSYGIPAIIFNGRGMRIENCLFYDSDYLAISYNGQNVKICNNEFYEVCTELSDMGAVYTGRNWNSADINIVDNYFRNIGPKTQSVSHNTVGVYVDDAVNDINISGNIFVGRDNERTDLNAIHYTQGPNILMNNNTFINFKNAVFISYRTTASFNTVFATLSNIPYKSLWYNAKYPQFLTLAEYNDSFYYFSPYKENSSISGNVSIDTATIKIYGSDDYHWNREMYIEETGNVTLESDALVNPDGGDYRIKSGNAAGLSSEIKKENNSGMSDFGVSDRYFEFKNAGIYDADGNMIDDLSSVTAGEKITVKEEISGNKFNEEEFTYILAIYDDKDRLIKVSTQKGSFLSDSDEQSVLETEAPELPENCKVKVMRVKDMSSLEPVGKSCLL